MSPDIEKPKSIRMSLREKGRKWFLTLGTVLALLATTIGFLSDSLGVWEFMNRAGPTPDQLAIDNEKGTLVGLATPTLTIPTPIRESRASTSSLLSNNSVAPLTPLPEQAAENELLLLVAQFSNFVSDANYNVAGRIQEALAEQVVAAHLQDTRVAVWPEVIERQNEAIAVLQGSGATMVIWGEYDSGRVRVRFSLAGGGEEPEWERLLGTPSELSTTINLEVPRETQALALMALGRLYRKEGQVDMARAAFAYAVALEPSDANTLATLAFYLAALDAAAQPPKWDSAITGYTKVIELRPKWVNARYNRGLAYFGRYWAGAGAEDLDNAIDDFTWTVAAKVDYDEAYINRAISYFARNGEGDTDASIVDLTTALRYNPMSYRAYYNRALAYMRLDRQPLWVADLERALELEPNFWLSHHAMCWGYALDMLPDEGLPYCNEATTHETVGLTRDGRGLVMAELGRLDEAMADIEHYLAWLDTQPDVWSVVYKRPVYEELLEGLRSGENLVTPELLARLR